MAGTADVASNVSLTTKRRSWLGRFSRSEVRMGYLFLGPAVLLLTVFVYFPVVGGVLFSLTDFDPLAKDFRWVGLSNFIEVLTTRVFWYSVRNTLIYTAIHTPVTIGLGFAAALLLNRQFRGVGFLRGAYYLPGLTSTIAVGMVFILLTGPRGVITSALALLGFDARDYLLDPATALVTIALVTSWQGFGGSMIIYLAALQGVPREIEEAALIDGCSKPQYIRFVMWPLVRPVTFYLVVVGLIGSMQVFDIVNFIATAGVSSDNLTTIAHQVYLNAFRYSRGGYASAMAVALAILIGVATFTNFRLIKWEFEY